MVQQVGFDMEFTQKESETAVIGIARHEAVGAAALAGGANRTAIECERVIKGRETEKKTHAIGDSIDSLFGREVLKRPWNMWCFLWR